MESGPKWEARRQAGETFACYDSVYMSPPACPPFLGTQDSRV